MCGKRIYGSWGIEHVVIKGNNGIKIFKDNEDCRYFMNLFHSKQESSTSLISYVLMSNHVHLILKEKSPEKISKLMMNICGPYSYWFNQKYHRKNALFRQRFYNESIKEEKHLLNAIHYVHNNPVKARLISHPQEYLWSSYNEYKNKPIYIDKTIFLEYFSQNDYLFEISQIAKSTGKSEMFYQSYEYATWCTDEYISENGLIDCDHMTLEERNLLIQDLYYKKNISYDFIAENVNMKKESVRKIVGKMNPV